MGLPTLSVGWSVLAHAGITWFCVENPWFPWKKGCEVVEGSCENIEGPDPEKYINNHTSTKVC